MRSESPNSKISGKPMKPSRSIMLDGRIIENFSERYTRYLRTYKLSYWMHRKGPDGYQDNIIHSAILWIRESATRLNRIEQGIQQGSCDKDFDTLALIIVDVHSITEATDQLHRVLYDTTKPAKDDSRSCFRSYANHEENEKPDGARSQPFGYSTQFDELSDTDMFDMIRAAFLEHGVNLKNDSRRWYADVPRSICGSRRARLFGYSDADYSTRIWTQKRNDKQSFHMLLNTDDLFAFAQKRYGLVTEFDKRLIKIAYSKELRSMVRTRCAG